MIFNKVLIIRNANFYDFGGAEKFPILLALCLKKNNYDSVVVSKNTKLLEFAKRNDIKTIKGFWWKRQNWSGWRIIFTPLYLVWQLVLYLWYLYIILKTKSNIIHVNSKDDFIAATLAGKTLRKKVIWTDHADLKHVFKNLNIWYKNPIGKIIYFCGLLADHLVVVSKEEKRLILQNLRSNNNLLRKIKLVYNGVLDERPKLKSIKRTAFTYGLTSRIVTDKGISEAILAFNRISTKYINARLIIIGGGPEFDKFKKLASSNNSITFAGHINNPLLKMSEFDVFIQPTYHEAFSLVLVEASMLGLPIIATNVGGNPEIIIDHKTGLLVDVKDVDSLYKAMEELYLDSKLRLRISKEARKQYLEKFNFDDIVRNQYIPLYEK